MLASVARSIRLASFANEWQGTVIEAYGKKIAEMAYDESLCEDVCASLRNTEPGGASTEMFNEHIELAKRVGKTSMTRMIYDKLGPAVHVFGAVAAEQSNAIYQNVAKAEAAAAVSGQFLKEYIILQEFAGE